ncbi:LuxR C-terminal-related transcriptional regulator [Kitasatospora purpeofusca]|uniref:LuxR C-terminal-related transcriptional regulator n=1 Tax=Kitasatospora purpeofusca TaxID=67352 RepID=UPI001FC9D8CA|nr:LuxR C-terminal-related transcriptional regulator [Kitasatospora purpeofusca]
MCDLLATGVTDKDIAAALFLSTRTVENHVARVRTELRTTRADLTRTGRQHGGQHGGQHGMSSSSVRMPFGLPFCTMIEVRATK